MDMAFPSFVQFIVVPVILPLLPPAAVMFLTEEQPPAIEKNVEEFTATDSSESTDKSES